MHENRSDLAKRELLTDQTLVRFCFDFTNGFPSVLSIRFNEGFFVPRFRSISPKQTNSNLCIRK